MDAVIAAHNLVKFYQMGEETVHALDGVNFSIDRGSYVAIMGPSGSGKSTLMNLIGGLDTPTEGSLVIDGADVGALSDSDLARFRNNTIGYSSPVNGERAGFSVSKYAKNLQAGENQFVHVGTNILAEK